MYIAFSLDNYKLRYFARGLNTKLFLIEDVEGNLRLPSVTFGYQRPPKITLAVTFSHN